jgi:hypothetical protein
MATLGVHQSAHLREDEQQEQQQGQQHEGDGGEGARSPAAPPEDGPAPARTQFFDMGLPFASASDTGIGLGMAGGVIRVPLFAPLPALNSQPPAAYTGGHMPLSARPTLHSDAPSQPSVPQPVHQSAHLREDEQQEQQQGQQHEGDGGEGARSPGLMRRPTILQNWPTDSIWNVTPHIRRADLFDSVRRVESLEMGQQRALPASAASAAWSAAAAATTAAVAAATAYLSSPVQHPQALFDIAHTRIKGQNMKISHVKTPLP